MSSWVWGQRESLGIAFEWFGLPPLIQGVFKAGNDA
jgi:hypothetical protein